MESLYVLIPLSVGIVLAIIGILGWAINAGQFDDLEREGTRILADDVRESDRDPKDLSRADAGGADEVADR